MQPEISIIIVHYRVERELLECIASIKSIQAKHSYEIIVVDNDEKKTITKNLQRKYPDVIYIPNPKNSGWGGGVNVGAEKARGKYLYFLNPDTLVLTNVLDQSIKFYNEHPDAGIVASLLCDKDKEPYALQGTEELTPLKGLVVYSALNKRFPNNPISKAFFYKQVKRDQAFQIEIAPLSASMIPTELFQKAGMFDPEFFLYFEEYDFGKRVNKLGFTNYILPTARVVHYWESSAKQRTDRDAILEKSRKRYFKKYYGNLVARLTEGFLRRDLKMLVVE